MRTDRSERITAPATGSGEEARALAMEELSQYVSQLNRYGTERLIDYANVLSGCPCYTDATCKVVLIRAAKREVQE